MNSFCTQCGTKFEEGALFCTGCGSNQKSNQPEQTQAQSQTSVAAKPETPEIAVTFEPVQAVETPVSSTQAAPSPSSPPELNVQFEAGESPMEQLAKSSKPPHSSGMRAVFIAISVICSLVLFVAITFIQSMVFVKEIVDVDTIRSILDTTVMEINLAMLPVGEVANSANVDLPDFERLRIRENTALYRVVYNSLHEYYITNYNITPNTVYEILSNQQLNRFAGDIVENGFDFIVNGYNANEPIVSSDKIIGLIVDNADEIARISGFDFESNEEYREILEQTLVQSGIDELTWSEATGINSQLNDVRNAFGRRNLNTVLILILVGGVLVALGIIVALFFLNLHQKTNVLLYAGIPTLVSGFMMVMGGIAINLIIPIVVEEAPYGMINFVPIVENILQTMVSSLFVTGFVALGFGTGMIVAKIVFKIFVKGKPQVANS